MHKADLVANVVGADRFVRRWRLEDQASAGDGSLVLCLVGAVHAVLKKMEGHRECLETQLGRKTKLAEAKEVFVKILSKVAADELFAAIVEGSNAIGTGMIAQSRSLRAC